MFCTFFTFRFSAKMVSVRDFEKKWENLENILYTSFCRNCRPIYASNLFENVNFWHFLHTVCTNFHTALCPLSNRKFVFLTKLCIFLCTHAKKIRSDASCTNMFLMHTPCAHGVHTVYFAAPLHSIGLWHNLQSVHTQITQFVSQFLSNFAKNHPIF